MIRYPIPISPERAELLLDLVDSWLEESEEAAQQVEADRSLTSPEDLLKAISGMHEQFKELQEFRSQLETIRRVSSAAS